jgi:hypothetical protein
LTGLFQGIISGFHLSLLISIQRPWSSMTGGGTFSFMAFGFCKGKMMEFLLPDESAKPL